MATLLRMPSVAAGATDAVLQEWTVAENAAFSATDSLAAVETDKAVVDVPASGDGVVLKHLVAAGERVEVGAAIAVLGDPGEQVGDVRVLLRQLGIEPATEPVGGAGGKRAVGPVERVFASPLARRMAREAGLDVERLNGSGPGGRIIRRDVEAALAEAERPQSGIGDVERPESGIGGIQRPQSGIGGIPERTTRGVERTTRGFVDVPHSRMRAAIADRLSASQRDVPQFSLRATVRVGKLLKLRDRLNAAEDAAEDTGVRISITDLVVKAAGRAHALVPELNVVWLPEAVRSFATADIGIAVSTDRGLVTPVLRGVEALSVSAVAARTEDLIGRARAGTLRQDELEGGTLTISNLGGYGTEEFTAIINPPQAAILAVGAVHEEPLARKGKLTTGQVIRVTLTVDHRPVDGAVAARWLAAFTGLLESPLRILA